MQPNAAEERRMIDAGYDPNDPTQLEAFRSIAARRRQHLAALENELDTYKRTGKDERAAQVEEQIRIFKDGDRKRTRTAGLNLSK